MSGLKFEIDQDFIYGLSVAVDPRITSGSLILLEPARDGISGIPNSLVNYAAEEAKLLTGAAVDSVTTVNTISSLSGAYVERTTKGGIHGVIPSTVNSAPTARAYFGAKIPKAIQDYIAANPTHAIYMSVCGLVTRSVGQAQSNSSIMLAGLNSQLNPVSDTQITTSVYQSKTGTIAGSRSVTDVTLGRTTDQVSPFLSDGAQSRTEITVTTDATHIKNDLFSMGVGNITSGYNNMPSWILYSLYVEDLTVSGQTYAQAHSKSQAVFNSRFGVGGLYVDDTWTTPT